MGTHILHGLGDDGFTISTLMLGFNVETLIKMHCDNQSAILITNNITFHEPTKHVEVDCHYFVHQDV